MNLTNENINKILEQFNETEKKIEEKNNQKK